ncbi:MAG: PilZ domain-containing protein [Nitrospirae bacterium]|nr:PilZ domain-containing protein [Nitrospirota bacterium]
MVLLASVPVFPGSEEVMRDQLSRAKKEWCYIDISMHGISFPVKWNFKPGDMLEIQLKTNWTKAILFTVKVVRTVADGAVLKTAARYFALNDDAERKLSQFIMDCQRNDCRRRLHP